MGTFMLDVEGNFIGDLFSATALNNLMERIKERLSSELFNEFYDEGITSYPLELAEELKSISPLDDSDAQKGLGILIPLLESSDTPMFITDGVGIDSIIDQDDPEWMPVDESENAKGGFGGEE